MRRRPSRSDPIRRSTRDGRTALRHNRLRRVRRRVRVRDDAARRRRASDASHARGSISIDHATGDGLVSDERFRTARHAIDRVIRYVCISVTRRYLYFSPFSDLDKVSRGIGDKIGIFFMWATVFVGGLAVGFISEWRLSLFILGLSPILAIVGLVESKVRDVP